jgi:ketosteroid isomerase-like protein
MEQSMKKTLVWCVVAVLSLMIAVQAQDKRGSGTEKAVAALEQQWLQSQKTNNPDLVAPLLADKFTNTGIDGKVSEKAAMLATAKATKYDSVDYEDLRVTVFGRTAIAMGVFKATGTDESGKPMDLRERFTDTWVEMPSGKWQCVASQGSPIKM